MGSPADQSVNSAGGLMKTNPNIIMIFFMNYVSMFVNLSTLFHHIRLAGFQQQ